MGEKMASAEKDYMCSTTEDEAELTVIFRVITSVIA